MRTYVNLKDLADFNAYTMGLGAGVFAYADAFASGHPLIRTLAVLLGAVVVLLGVVVMSAKGRIKGDDIDYATETDPDRIKLFKAISRVLTAQMGFLLAAILVAGYLSLLKLWTPA